MKKFLSLTLVVLLIVTFSFNSVALSTGTDGEEYSYTFSDGITVLYYLDDSGNPYTYANGEKQYMLLPLEHLRITEQERVDELNSQIGNNSPNGITVYSNPPTNYYDLSGRESPTRSVMYTQFVDLEVFSKGITPPLKLNSLFGKMNVTTANLKKKIFSGKIVKLILEYYSNADGSWYSEVYEMDFTGKGQEFIVYPEAFPFARLTVSKSSSGIKNFTLQVYTWGF